MRVHTGVGHANSESTQLRKNSYSCASDGVRTSGQGIHWISRPTLYQLSHPFTLSQLDAVFVFEGEEGHTNTVIGVMGWLN